MNEAERLIALGLPMTVDALLEGIEAQANGRKAGENIPENIPWQTAAEIASTTPAEVDWAWRDYLALGTVVELDAKLKAGKTTFVGHLLLALLDGHQFLGRETLSGPIVYLTEEGNRSFRQMLARAALTERSDVHVLSKRRVPQLDWWQLVDAAKQKVREVGGMILIVDTLGKMAGFKDDDENSAGKAMAAMTPLQALATELNIVVIVVRHERKSGGEVGDSARGSSAFGGDADVILQLTRVGGKGRERQRYLRGLGRFDETPAEITIELRDDGYHELTGTDARDAALRALVTVLPSCEGDAVPIVDLLADLKEGGHSRTHVYEAVDLLLSQKRAAEDKQKGPTGRQRKVIWLRSSDDGT